MGAMAKDAKKHSRAVEAGAPPFDLGALSAFADDACRRVGEVSDLSHLEELSTELLGKRGWLSVLKAALGDVLPKDRPVFGEALNDARVRIEAALVEKKDALAQGELMRAIALDRLDLTEVLAAHGPGHLHLVTQVQEELEDIFVGMGYEIAEGPEVETDWYNFTALNMPRDHPARSIQDSFYLDIGDKVTHLLRSQTSPAQIRLLERGELPIYAVAPGRVYRRDTPDARHLSVFHQIEGLVVDKAVSFGDLAGTIDVFVKAIFGDAVSSRLRPAYFPFTEPSAEFEITCTICGGEGCKTCGQIGWIELGGCGMVHPAVFEATGVDAETWSGFAFGFGIDRIAIMRHEIEDIRSLLENDVRFLTQF